MVYHKLCHAAVDADILACDEACLVGAEEHHHICNIKRITYTSAGLLRCIGTFVDFIGRIYPARGNGVHTHLICKTDRQCVSEGSYTATLSLNIFHSLYYTY